MSMRHHRANAPGMTVLTILAVLAIVGMVLVMSARTGNVVTVNNLTVESY